MVEIFKTNVTSSTEATIVVAQLKSYLPYAKINMDLNDCDNILRIEDSHINVEAILKLTTQMSIDCEWIVE